MKFRFVFVNQSGAEVEARSVEELRSCVASGAIHEETLLYDGLTRDWAPARVHPVFRLIRDIAAAADSVEVEVVDSALTALALDEEALDRVSLEGEPAADLLGRAEGDLSAGAAGEKGARDRITLAPETSPDALAEFWAAQERERAESHSGADSGIEGFGRFNFGRELNPPGIETGATVFSSKATAADGGERAPSSLRPLPPQGDARSTPGSSTASSAIPAPAVALLQRLDIPDWGLRWASREEIARAMSTPVPQRQAALMIVLAGVGGWGIADSWTPPIRELDNEVVVLTNSWRVSPHFTAGHPEVLSGAFQDMVRGMDVMRARMKVGDPPGGLMTDRYLADPAAFPEVEDHWLRYGALVDSLRDREEDFFRSGFVSRMQRKGITGTVLSIQVTRGLIEFRDVGPRREGLYVAMAELSKSALTLHALLKTEAATGDMRRAAIERVVLAMTQVAGEDPRDAGRLGSSALRALDGTAEGTLD